MWCYQRPGFEALLLAELQRQQQCSQLCDTVLQAEGISVPAHSCVLSALSPQLSCTLSSTPPPPAGQSHLLDFRKLGACTLLQIVRLLYSGEMGGEGEEERQEAIAAAGKLGIRGLVEVRNKDHDNGREGGGQRREVGVQTEVVRCEENESRWSKWRREVRDGCTLLWKETLPSGERDTWTQTEEPEARAARSPRPAASFQTVNTTAIQTSAEPDSQPLPPDIPYVPVSLLCPKDGDRASAHPPPSSVLIVPSEESAAAPVFILPQSYSSVLPPSPSTSHASAPETLVTPPCAADHQSWWAGPQEAGREVMAAEGGEGEGFEQFKDNIPGFINYFLNPDQEEGARGRHAARRRAGGARGARRAGTGEGGARRPRARGQGRGAAQAKDVDKVVVSPLQDSWMRWRWGVQASRTGKGGATAGRKFHLKTRERMQPNKMRRRRGKAWQISKCGEALPAKVRRGGHTQGSRKRSASQDNAPASKKARAKSVPFDSSSMPKHSIQGYAPLQNRPAPRLSTKPPNPNPLSPSTPYVIPATPLLHTTPLPPLDPPPQEDQVEQFERLLEEVMMGLDIIPNNNSSSAPHPQPTSGTCPSSGSTFVQKQQQQHCLTSGPQGAGSSPSLAKGEMPFLQQPQGEGELNDILDDFLRSFEQHIASSAGEDVEMHDRNNSQASQPQPYTALREHNKTQIRAKTAHTPHVELAHSPSVAEADIHRANTPNSALHTPPLLSPLTNTPHPTPVSAPLPHSHSVVTNEREENKAKILTRRQRRERVSSPEETPGVKVTELLEREKSHPRTPPDHLQPCSVSLDSAGTRALTTDPPRKHPKAPGNVNSTRRRLAKRRKSQKKQKRVRTPVGTSDTTKTVCGRRGKATQQMPGVKLEQTGPLPGEKTDVTSQEYSSLQVKENVPLVEKTEECPQPISQPAGRLRSKVKGHLTQPVRINKNHLQVDATDKLKTKGGMPKRNTQLFSLSNVESSRALISPSLMLQRCDRNERTEKWGDKQKEVTVPPEAEAPETARRAEKRCMESEEEKSDADVAKKVRVLTTHEPWTPSSEPAPSVSEPRASTQDCRQEVAVTVETDEEVDVEITSLPDDENNRDWVRQTLTSQEKEDAAWTKIKREDVDQNGESRVSLTDKETESSSDELIVVDGDSDATPDLEDLEDDYQEQIEKEQRTMYRQNLPNGEEKTSLSHLGALKPPVLPPMYPAAEVKPGSTGSWEEESGGDEVDVIAGSSPVPEPLTISWTETSESEDEVEIDVTGVEMDYVSSTSLLSSLL